LRAFPGSPKLSLIPERLFVPTEIPSHTHGMVGFVKELLDACHLGKMAIPRSGSGRYLEYGISPLYISAGVVIVEKAA
jgi:hypothetical protein